MYGCRIGMSKYLIGLHRSDLIDHPSSQTSVNLPVLHRYRIGRPMKYFDTPVAELPNVILLVAMPNYRIII